MRYIDVAVLAACTRASHALQRATGLTNFFVAKVGISLFSIGLIAQILAYWMPSDRRSDISDLIAALVMLGGAEYYRRHCEANESRLWRGDILLPPPFVFLVVFRLFSLSFLVTRFVVFDRPHALLTWLQNLFSLGYAMFVYFVAILPLPPGQSRVQQFVQGFAAAFQRAQLVKIKE